VIPVPTIVPTLHESQMLLPIGAGALVGDLHLPEGATGMVLFAHGSGSSRTSPRNRQVARALNGAGLATLLFDLLTPAEDHEDQRTRAYRFDIELLAQRLGMVTEAVARGLSGRSYRLGYFGASTGAAAALIAAARYPTLVHAVVSRGGRPDLAGRALPDVQAPTLLIVGGHDPDVLTLNYEAFRVLRAEKAMEVVPGATHLFEEPGTLEEVARLATGWFLRFLAGTTPDV
jgi:putative phosphoribosyl transferase